MKNTVLKNTGAVIAGFVAALILTIGMDTLLEGTGIFPTVEEQQKYGFNVLWMNILAILYRMVFTAFGGYLTAKISTGNPMRNVNILGVAGTIIAVIANTAVSQIPEMANVLPLWFSFALVLIAYPSAWLGGRLAVKNSNNE